jgi:glycosyl hydrolase family 26
MRTVRAVRAVSELRIVALLLGVLVGLVAGCGGGGSGGRTAREFGVAVDPWQTDTWARSVGARPTMVMEFEAWSHDRTLDTHFAAARAEHLQSFMVTWEPWVPVDPALGTAAQVKPQPAFSNASIAAGRQDAYVHAFARSVAAAGLIVYLRFAHEMNGNWYPWSLDPAHYIAAWRHVVDIFRAEHATNARFVFSVNPQLFTTDAQFTAQVRRYWPGASYVDYLGSSMINFGGSRHNDVARYADRIRLVHRLFGEQLLLTEVNSAAEDRVTWFTDLRSWLNQDEQWIKGVVLSQAGSRGKVSFGDQAGTMDWDVTTDGATRPIIRGMIDDIRGRP